jgi:hypothetical protein
MGTKIEEDKYLILTGKKTDRTPIYSVVNRTVLAATQDYYYKYHKIQNKKQYDATKKVYDFVSKTVESAINNQEYSKANNQVSQNKIDYLINEWDGPTKQEYQNMDGWQKTLINKTLDVAAFRYDTNKTRMDIQGISPERYKKMVMDDASRFPEKQYKKKYTVKIISDNRSMFSGLDLHQAVNPVRNKWEGHREYIQDLKQQMIDMELQYQDGLTLYAKGQETAYGRTGAKNDILNSHGVLVKRQNGDPITKYETEEIKKALDSVYSVFGDRSSFAKKAGLLVSHSGGKAQHARKALGLFHPLYQSVGVTWAGGENQAGFTLAHEFAHFMDHELAKKENKTDYLSEDPSHVCNKIASTFRQNMKTPQKSDYQNRTIECFARALEQYHATKTGSIEEYQRDVNDAGNHPRQEVFEKQVMPLIEQFFKENDKLIKSINLKAVLLRDFLRKGE